MTFVTSFLLGKKEKRKSYLCNQFLLGKKKRKSDLCDPHFLQLLFIEGEEFAIAERHHNVGVPVFEGFMNYKL